MILATLSPAGTILQETAVAPMLVARGVRKRFGATHALQGIDFHLDRGEIVAIMGPSGTFDHGHIHLRRATGVPGMVPRSARLPVRDSSSHPPTAP